MVSCTTRSHVHDKTNDYYSDDFRQIAEAAAASVRFLYDGHQIQHRWLAVRCTTIMRSHDKTNNDGLDDCRRILIWIPKRRRHPLLARRTLTSVRWMVRWMVIFHFIVNTDRKNLVRIKECGNCNKVILKLYLF